MFRTLRRSADYKRMPQAAHYPIKTTPMLPPGTFDGKVAFITGGGTGLGKGMATTLSHLGATVAITGRRKHVLDDTAAEISEKTGNPVLTAGCDVRDPVAVKEALQSITEQSNIPDIVINNAAGNFISPTERLRVVFCYFKCNTPGSPGVIMKKRFQVQMLLILLSILFSRDLLMLPLRLVKWLLPHKRLERKILEF